jgi:HAD superfamily hydrolase (TIGR01509 family)
MGCNIFRPACVIFDIDGTLTETNELIFASFNYVAEKYLGRRFAPPEIVALFGPPEEGTVLKMFGPDHLDAIMEDLLGYYADHHASMASLHEGIDEILQYLRNRGVKLAVFTGKGRRTAMITLDALHLTPHFDFIVSGNDVVHHKPHPEGILRVLDKFGLKPEEAMMVGDSLSDVHASHAAGVPVASVLWDSIDPVRVKGANPDYVFENVRDMLSWFKTNLDYNVKV